MFLFIVFLVCYSFTFDIVMIDNKFMYMFAKRLILFMGGLGGRFHVSVVLRCRLPANAPYWPGRVVDRGGNSPVESFVVHPPLIRTVEHHYYRESLVSVLVFFDDITIHKYDLNLR